MNKAKLLGVFSSAFVVAGTLIGTGGVALTHAQTLVPIDTGVNPQVVAQSKGNGQTNLNENGNMDVALTLNSPNQQALDTFVQSLYDPSSANYRKYLTPDEFASEFGQSQSTIDSLVNYFHSFGLQTTVYAGNLDINIHGPLQKIYEAFNTSAQSATYKNQNFTEPTQAPTLPSEFKGVVKAAIGLNTLSDYVTHIAHQHQGQGENHGTSPTGHMPNDLLRRYNATPLVKSGNTGAGQTIGIATLADFHTSDAYYFWNYLGLNVNSSRINKISVDGGATSPIGWNSGSDETTLDVEQSGALAPGANIDVYEAPNTNAGFTDLFYAVAGDDKVNEMSVSWGESEDFIDSSYANAIALATEQGAAEGISMFAAAGDNGAYDGSAYGDNTLSVDNPADSPYITAAGGTTLPGTQDYGSAGSVTVSTERVWGWDYLEPLFGKIFSVGGGGGFSQYFGTPWYQAGLKRPQSHGTDPHSNQRYASERSLPDVSMNADPQTGYSMYVSFPSDTANYLYQGWNTFGGTSFVAPQLAGLTALMNQADNTQIGFWNPQIYSSNAASTFNDITSGDNWYYNGVKGYDEGSGLGTPNVAKLAAALK